MDTNLREKFERIMSQILSETHSSIPTFKFMEAAYNLGKSENEAIIKALSENTESMGETNKQLVKRLQKVNSIMKSNHTASLKCTLIEPVLNPPIEQQKELGEAIPFKAVDAQSSNIESVEQAAEKQNAISYKEGLIDGGYNGYGIAIKDVLMFLKNLSQSQQECQLDYLIAKITKFKIKCPPLQKHQSNKEVIQLIQDILDLCYANYHSQDAIDILTDLLTQISK